MLYNKGFLDEKLNRHLKAMVGFRNIAVHDYQAVQIEIVKTIIDKHLTDFTDFTKKLKEYMSR
ncbi:type VII toxin-antitoxin system HepT family RNase toxin [Paenibacillus durus]|uniref:type VII toxin-antitoxin system HepT family RNase toxin n=1 Tax=Paenibacillus durus TaxID=44251 RepID=UPI0005A6CB16|nr:HepT-like ribonuclease domain-containing protein [Paenibacillus durus]